MSYAALFGWAGVVILLYVASIWIASVIKRDTGIVDIFWGAGFVVAGLVYFLLAGGWPLRKGLALILVAAWGLRLTAHIAIRNHGRPEDRRYAAWRAKHADTWWWRSFFTVFLLQGLLMWIISLPLLSTMYAPEPLAFTWFDGLGVAFWAVGMFFEVVGDWQLLQFKSDPANRGLIMDRGLWAYTRHPNYFGETLIWWGFWLLAVPSADYWTIVSPILITVLLLRFSGVTLLERTMIEAKPAYRDYIAKTSAFIPMPPKR
jgi:steroid 5-alpha reductase family enzyme